MDRDCWLIRRFVDNCLIKQCEKITQNRSSLQYFHRHTMNFDTFPNCSIETCQFRCADSESGRIMC